MITRILDCRGGLPFEIPSDTTYPQCCRVRRDGRPYLASHRGVSVSAMVDIVKKMNSKNVFHVDSV